MEHRHQNRAKRFLKLCISLTYFTIRFLRNLVLRASGRKRPGTCTILYYHSVASENQAEFARQMDLLSRLTTPVRADLRDRLQCGTRYAAVTFDDGVDNLLGTALPELKKRMIPCVIFIIAGAFGKVPDWMVAPAGSPTQPRLMTIDEVKGLSPDLVTIGAHTLTHPNLLMLDEENARREISESRAHLEGLLNREVTLFSFPYGAFNERLVDLCRAAGYERIFTTLPYPALSEPEEFVSGRVWAEPTDWPLEFRMKLLGAYEWLPKAFSIKRKILRYAVIARILRAGSLRPLETLHRHVR